MTLHKSKANVGRSLDDFLKEEGIYENTNSTAIRRVQNYHLEMGNELNTSAESIRFENDSLWVELADGRTIGVPLAWFPRLMNATDEERADYSISPYGLHWDCLDEDITVEGLLAGKSNRAK